MEVFIAVIGNNISIEVYCQFTVYWPASQYLYKLQLSSAGRSWPALRLHPDSLHREDVTHQKHSVVCEILPDRACSRPRNYFLSLNRQPEQGHLTWRWIWDTEVRAHSRQIHPTDMGYLLALPTTSPEEASNKIKLGSIGWIQVLWISPYVLTVKAFMITLWGFPNILQTKRHFFKNAG